MTSTLRLRTLVFVSVVLNTRVFIKFGNASVTASDDGTFKMIEITTSTAIK